MALAPEEATGSRRIDIQAGGEHRRRIPRPCDQQSVGLKEIKFRQYAWIEVGMDACERGMDAAEHRVSVLHLTRLIRPMPARLGLCAIEHMEALARPRRLLRQSVKERRAVWGGDIGEDDEAHLRAFRNLFFIACLAERIAANGCWSM